MSDDLEKTYVFYSTDGELCSATVHVALKQEYTYGGAVRVYGKRNGCVWMTYVATYTIPSLTARNPEFVDSSGETVKTFSPWTKYEVILPAGAYCAYAKENSTSAGYSSANSYYLMQGYLVGNSNYVVPSYGGNLKLKLGS